MTDKRSASSGIRFAETCADEGRKANAATAVGLFWKAPAFAIEDLDIRHGKPSEILALTGVAAIDGRKELEPHSDSLQGPAFEKKNFAGRAQSNILWLKIGECCPSVPNLDHFFPSAEDNQLVI